MKKKLLKKTSYQKTKEEFESMQEKRRKKKEVTCSVYHLLLIITLEIRTSLCLSEIVFHKIRFQSNLLLTSGFASFFLFIPGLPEEQAAERGSY